MITERIHGFQKHNILFWSLGYYKKIACCMAVGKTWMKQIQSFDRGTLHMIGLENTHSRVLVMMSASYANGCTVSLLETALCC